MILIAELIVAAIVCGAMAWLFFTVSEGNITAMEKLCRNRNAGILLALPCAMLCVPLAVPVSPGFLLIWLWPLAIALPVLCYFFIDYYAARGLAFFLILFAYDMVHGLFDNHIAGAPVLTVIAMLTGIAGIWISAKPCTLRDIFRKAALNKKWKYISAALSAITAAAALYTFVMILYGVFAK